MKVNTVRIDTCQLVDNCGGDLDILSQTLGHVHESLQHSSEEEPLPAQVIVSASEQAPNIV